MTAYPLGQNVKIGIGPCALDGIATNPATMTLTVTLPDATTSVTTITGLTNDTTGVFHLDYLPPQAGTYAWRAVGTVPNFAQEGGFEVAAAGKSDLSIVDLDEWKNFANLTSNTGPGGDAELQDFLNGAHSLIDYRVGGILPTARTETVDGGWVDIALKKSVISVTTVLEVIGGRPYTITEQPLSSDPTSWTSYGFTRDGAVLTRRARGYAQNWAPGRKNIVVTYQSGLTLTTAETALVKEAIKELTTHFWATQQGNRKKNPTEWSPIMAYALPNNVREKIAPWDLGPRAA